MGLDMYAYSMTEDAVIDDFSYDRDYATEIRYWRKHNALHNWMEKLFHSKGGTNTFDCIPLRLTKEDMELLILDIKTSKVTPVTGFFFGSQDYYDDDAKSNYIRFAHQVMAEIDDGKAVYYDSWW